MVTIIKFQDWFWGTLVCHWCLFSEVHLETEPRFKWVDIVTCFTVITWCLSAQPMSGRKKGVYPVLYKFRWTSCSDWRCVFPIHQVLGALELLVSFLCPIRELQQGIKKHHVANVFMSVLEKQGGKPRSLCVVSNAVMEWLIKVSSYWAEEMSEEEKYLMCQTRLPKSD